jgi:hypothetical protein
VPNVPLPSSIHYRKSLCIVCGLNRGRDRQMGIQFRIDAKGDLKLAPVVSVFSVGRRLDGLESLDPIRFQSYSS